MRLLTKADRALIWGILIIALSVYLVFAFSISVGFAESVEIFVDGELYASYGLRSIKGVETVKISSEYGINIIKITSHGVKMTDASCPDKSDVKCGEITKPNQMIICAPNKVSVRLVGSKANVDKVTY